MAAEYDHHSSLCTGLKCHIYIWKNHVAPLLFSHTFWNSMCIDTNYTCCRTLHIRMVPLRKSYCKIWHESTLETSMLKFERKSPEKKNVADLVDCFDCAVIHYYFH